jgi:predicted Zn-dependent peptidase
VVFLYVTESDPDHMTMSLNAVNHFKKKETLTMIGVEDPTGVEVSSVRVVFTYQRQ